MTTRFDKRILLKWCGVACIALALAYAARISSEISNDVHLTYYAPGSQLQVTLYDHAGLRIRRTHFSTADFSHRVVLPKGNYRIELVPGRLKPYSATFEVHGDVSLEITYPQ